jgi:hypothetical protein
LKVNKIDKKKPKKAPLKKGGAYSRKKVQKKPEAQPKVLDEQSTKPKVIGGKGMMNPSTGKKFTSEYQPSSEAKKAGIRRSKTLRELLTMPLKSKLPKSEEQFIRQVMNTYGIEREEVDVRLFMEMKLAQRAYKDGDAIAYKALLDRAFGKPMQEQPPVVDTPTGEKSIIDLGDGLQLEI